MMLTKKDYDDNNSDRSLYFPELKKEKKKNKYVNAEVWNVLHAALSYYKLSF